MSKAVLICLRSDISRPDFCREEDLIALSERLIPDNIQPRPPRLIRRDGVFLGIVNPHPTITIRGASLCLGQMIDPASDWWHPGADVPDGTYAIFRSDDRAVELVSDILATRTIWYVFQKDFFAASTSQRALVYFLRGFQPRPETTAWMLSSGTLGPDLSWDERIRGLPGDSRLVLDRAGWSLDLSKIPVEFQPDPGGDERHAANLRQALEDTMRAIDLDVSNWVLPLSGGYDSRALLLLSRKLRNMKAVTWGTRAALKDRDSDAWVGTRVARYFGMRHEYFEVDLSEEPLDKIVHRFLAAGEGRIDHITAYMDGFNLWKNLSESGCRGIVRGDEAFGCKPVQEAALIYQRFGLFILDDFPNLRPLRPSLAEMGQTRPARLDRRSGESLTTWADRMNAEVEIPVVGDGTAAEVGGGSDAPAGAGTAKRSQRSAVSESAASVDIPEVSSAGAGSAGTGGVVSVPSQSPAVTDIADEINVEPVVVAADVDSAPAAAVAVVESVVAPAAASVPVMAPAPAAAEGRSSVSDVGGGLLSWL